jgi:hypothetical protein
MSRFCALPPAVPGRLAHGLADCGGGQTGDSGTAVRGQRRGNVGLVVAGACGTAL